MCSADRVCGSTSLCNEAELSAPQFCSFMFPFIQATFFFLSILLLVVYLLIKAETGFSAANNVSLKNETFFPGLPEQDRSHRVVANRKSRIRKATSLGTSFIKLCALGFIRYRSLVKRQVINNGVLKRRMETGPQCGIQLVYFAFPRGIILFGGCQHERQSWRNKH